MHQHISAVKGTSLHVGYCFYQNATRLYNKDTSLICLHLFLLLILAKPEGM